eukprot:648875-Rhodomonas_salina.1
MRSRRSHGTGRAESRCSGLSFSLEERLSLSLSRSLTHTHTHNTHTHTLHTNDDGVPAQRPGRREGGPGGVDAWHTAGARKQRAEEKEAKEGKEGKE